MTTENLRITTEGQRRPPSAFQEDPRIYFNQWLTSSQVPQTAFWTSLARLKCFSNTGFLNAFKDFIWDAGNVSQHLLAKLAWNANWQHSVKTSALLGDSLLDQKKKTTTVSGTRRRQEWEQTAHNTKPLQCRCKTFTVKANRDWKTAWNKQGHRTLKCGAVIQTKLAKLTTEAIY